MERLTFQPEEIEEVDTRGEDDNYFYFETMEQKIEHEIEVLGQPWNKPVNILEPGAEEKIKKHGEDARRLQELREQLALLQKTK